MMVLQNSARIHPKRVKLIFNPGAGAARLTTVGLVEIIRELLAWKFIPEVFLVEPGCDLPGAVRDALKDGIKLFFVCGGDGTISSTARILAGTEATLGIMPIGTQNNTALALGIPGDVTAAVSILRTGRRMKVDVGLISVGRVKTPFLEVVSVGLVSDLFQSADDIQHGNPTRVIDFLTTLAASPPANIQLLLENKKKVHSQGHVVLVSNMPVIGLHYQVGEPSAFHDGLLDVIFFAELSKLDLLGYVFSGVGVNTPEDPRIQHYQVRRMEIETTPAMPVMADGNMLGTGRVRIEIMRRALAVMVGPELPEDVSAVDQETTGS
jgi:diacylglycerol kinase (ATP)